MIGIVDREGVDREGVDREGATHDLQDDAVSLTSRQVTACVFTSRYLLMRSDQPLCPGAKTAWGDAAGGIFWGGYVAAS
ncbi:hypothetical protein [Rhodopirellula sallentina]|uniref:Uncharacterized protein n=1 Tax=Rhodopirellula sallentina SM41 TaxID=1263870 RepID=M5U3G7_9BACT|nr:hypothetical protein [Rhodopirellula sallentina]EMI52406.1 hypothetical protein RSSM_06118 [Rhodopirellula sallentina SM41]